MEHTCDTVIIGAGLAGITAARTFETYNQSLRRDDRTHYVVLEASDRIGGRVHSETITTAEGKKIKIEKGAQWLHKDIAEGSGENPLLPHVRKSSRLVHDDMPREFWHHGQRVNYDGNIRRINLAREIINQHIGADNNLTAIFTDNGLDSNASSLDTTFGPVETGAPLNQVSVEDVKNLVACNMGEFTREELSTFIKDYAAPVEANIKCNSAITKICWKQEGGHPIEIHTGNGDIYHAKHAVITVSVGVLKSGAITFEPPLPEAYQENLNHVKMGNFNKIFLLFDSKVKLPVNTNTHLDVCSKNDESIFYLGKDNGQQLVTTFMGDDLARLCDSNPDEAAKIAIRGLKEIWGEEITSHIIDTRVTRWGNDPLVRGGYSRVDVGYHHARDALAEPIDDRLFLAGEAVGAKNLQTGQNWSTHMPGAALSGERAANAVIAAMEKVKPLPYRHLVASDLGKSIARVS